MLKTLNLKYFLYTMSKIIIIGKRSLLANYLKKKLSSVHKITLKNFNEVKNNKSLGKFDYLINCSSYKIFKKKNINKDRDVIFAKKIKNSKCILIMISTSKVYGIKNCEKKSESDNCHPITSYGKSRFFVEKQIQKIIPNQYLILRLVNLINFDTRKKTGSKTAINTMIKDLLSKNIISVPSKKIYKDFITMNYFSLSVEFCIKKKLIGIYNLSSGFGTSLCKVARLLILGYGKGVIKKKKINTDSFVLDNKKLYFTLKKKLLKKNLYKEIIKIGKQMR